MYYIKIENEKYPIQQISPFKTQLGNDAIRVVSDAPLATEGFLIVDEYDEVISDRSNYKYLYREDDTCKEYTTVEEEIISTESFLMQDIPASPIQRQISSLNRRVSAVTPLTMSKKVYIGDTECTFDLVKGGNISAWLVTKDTQVECAFEVIDNKIQVLFDELEEVGTVNVSIQ